jgi:hypothetical protein
MCLDTKLKLLDTGDVTYFVCLKVSYKLPCQSSVLRLFSCP